MKRITKIILSLMAVLCIALCTMGTSAEGLQPDMSKPMSLTVSVGDISEMLSAVPQEDGTICYDLYRIADISEDGFTYQVTDKFSENSAIKEELSKASTTSDSESAPDWQALAQQAFAIAVGGEGTVVNAPSGADYTGLPLDKENGVSKGLYLLVARETLDNKSVVKLVSAVDADGENHYEDSQYAVCITAGENVYTITPQIVCVPTKVLANGSIAASTVEDGTWKYDQQIVLKMSVEPATGKIRINKTLTGHTGDEEVVCIFQVDAYYDNKLYSSEVYSVTFDGNGNKSLVIEGLPIGATVNVTEVYSGANYKATVSAPGSVTVSGSQMVSVDFENTRDNERSGGGITNHFTYQVNGGDGSWNLTTPTDNTQTVNGNRDEVLTQISGADATGGNDTNG